MAINQTLSKINKNSMFRHDHFPSFTQMFLLGPPWPKGKDVGKLDELAHNMKIMMQNMTKQDELIKQLQTKVGTLQEENQLLREAVSGVSQHPYSTFEAYSCAYSTLLPFTDFVVESFWTRPGK